MIIAIDFDGTIVTHEFPAIGNPIPSAIRVMKRLVDAGHQLILNTMRSDIENPDRSSKTGIQPEGGGNYLTEAVEYCRQQGIEFWGVNHNPEQDSWTHSPKVYAQYYVDDAAVGCPLVRLPDERPYVDWLIVEKFFVDEGILA